MFSLWPRDQNVRRDEKVTPVEFLNTGDVLRWLAFQALVQVPAVVDPPDLAQLFIGVGIEPGAFLTDGVRQKNLRGQARSRNLGFFEKLPAL